MPPQHKSLPEAELRMQKRIWLGKVSETGENYVATEQGVTKVRTVRRLQPDFKYDLALRNKTTGTPWSPRRITYDPKFTTLMETTALRPPSQSPRPPQRDAGQQTNAEDDVPQPPPSKQARTTAPFLLSTRPTTGSSSSQLPDSPMATSLTTRRHPPLPTPPTTTQPLRRLNQDKVMQPTKAQKTKEGTTVRTTEQDTTEPLAAIEIHDGTTLQSHTNDDPDEQQQPIVLDIEGFDESKLLEGMKTEATQMKLHEVYEEVDMSTPDLYNKESNPYAMGTP